MQDAEFVAGGHRFSMKKINALEQFHVMRRVGPIISDIVPPLGKLAKIKLEELPESEQFERFGEVLQPFMTGLSKLSDKDSEYVLYTLLAHVQVWQDEHKLWARIATKDAGIVMNNIEFPILMQAAGRAFWFNLSGFLASRPHKA